MTSDRQSPETGHAGPASPETDRARAEATRRLTRPLRLTRLGMVAERGARAFWPVWALLLLAVALLAFGVHDMVPPIWALIGGSVWAASIIGLGLWGVFRFRMPSRVEAVRRLDATMPGRPIQALTDLQAVGAADGGSAAVWAAHVRRMAERAGTARAPRPDLALAARDPYALRYVALLAAVMALLFGSIWRAASVGEIAGQAGPGAALASGPAWEGWIEPPAYTGRPDLYLVDQPEGALRVPEGSRVTIRLYGAPGDLDVYESISGPVPYDADETAPPEEMTARSFDVIDDGILSIEGDGGREWDIVLIPDEAPQVAFDGTMSREASGEMSQPFAASDDYGVVSGRARIALDLPEVTRRHGLAADPEPREPITVDLPMTISGDRTEFTEALVDDFSKHPWSGLSVEITLEVSDAAGQAGETVEPLEVRLPGRRFFQPVAAALIEQRRDLLWTRQNAPRVAQVLRAVSYEPGDVMPDSSSYLRLRTLIRRLEQGAAEGELADAARDEIAEELWSLALKLEEGSLADALERLRRAQDRVSEAIRNGASEEEIAELMDEMRQALDEYMRQLAQQQDPSQQDQQQAENTMEMSGDQLQQMLDRLQELMEEGRTAEAARLLEQLSQMMENMQVTQGPGQGQQPGQQAMDDLAETLRDQQGLSDDSFQNLQEQFGQGQQQPGQPGQQGQQPGQPGQGQQGQGQQPGQQGPNQQGQGQPGQGGAPSAEDLAQRQRELRRELERQQGGLPGAGTEEGQRARDSLGRAGEAMDRAEQALRQDDLAGAIDEQAQAMEELRQGMRDLGEAMARQQREQQGQQGQATGQAGPDGQRDPLGRDRGADGPLGTDENLLQGEDVYRRAEELLDEIRRRSADQGRPEAERDYLERLLERF
ncbi:TIGR02302 family protein [Roseicyclus sp. F158]|uniref:TIGR02302 family protein n=1 Tax=Tropicimonas omnivorans TaxID=3075590 RepID=A0ABU3DDV3_9RHOB|nr:TIGR02302 family protein [Roseicyclus sp. F158]MDT0681719.1 TIGR02302 family protein [Roseicyclus sp. F158]